MKEMLGSPTDTSCTTTIGTAATSHVMSSSSSPVSQTNMQPIVSPSNATPISNGTSVPPVSSQNSPPQSIVSPREFFFTLNTEREGELQLHSHYQFLLLVFFWLSSSVFNSLDLAREVQVRWAEKERRQSW